jgi:hypothetical protein
MVNVTTAPTPYNGAFKWVLKALGDCAPAARPKHGRPFDCRPAPSNAEQGAQRGNVLCTTYSIRRSVQAAFYIAQLGARWLPRSFHPPVVSANVHYASH